MMTTRKTITMLLITVGLALLFCWRASAQTPTAPPDTGTIAQFFANNPTNQFDVSLYGLNNTTSSQLDYAHGWGSGARVGYWITPSIGAALDVSYCDSSWTFASVGFAGRGTIRLGAAGSVTPYVTAGTGWNIAGSGAGATKSIVAIAGGGASLHLNKLTYFDLFGEFQHVTTQEAQDRVLFGITRKF